MPVKMKDIAQELGVSVVTVSKALRSHPDISKATRDRVMQRVKELDYRPNLTARSLVTGRSSLIGLIVPDLMHPFFADIAKGLSVALRKEGYFVLLSSSEEDPELEQQEMEHMMAHRLDAIVIASCHETPEPLAKVQPAEIPLILIDRSFRNFPSYFIGSDDYLVGKLATEHLLAVGCRRIAHVRGPEISVGKRRLKGFLDVMKKAGIPVPAEYIIPVGKADVDGRQHGAEVMRQLMQMASRPDGIFCFNDVIAMGVIAAAGQQGIRVPQELAVIGCGNLHFDDQISVPLSSIDQRSHEIGSRAAKLILEILKAEEPTACRDIVLQPKVIARASTARSV